MTSTVKFQIKPNFFSSEKEAKESERKKENTNPRYKAFNQTHFTAGDVDQFETYRDPTNGSENKEIILSKENIFHTLNIPLPNFRKYENLSPLSVNNTFSYLFHKFKKGIFIKIKDGKLAVFLPFSKKNYTNEWSKRIKFSDNFFSNLEKLYKEETKIYFSRTSINKFPDCWYANNFLLRYEFPIHEGDTNNTIFADFFETLCRERAIPDMEFFVNRRDMPLLTMDGTEPYNHIFDSETQPLLSHNYSEYSPVLSMVSNEKFADIAIPTGDDWSRVERNSPSKGGKFFVDTCGRSFDISKKVEWEKRIPTAVFRGASTGAGVTVETNPRLKAAYLSTLKKEENGIPLLDAGITEWNLRARKLSGSPCLQTIDVKSLPFSLVPRLDPNEQVKYKYILNIPGHVAAYRLSLELFSESCILLVESDTKLWFTHLLKPFIHYVPVKNNLEDLFEKILWCRKNDEKAKEIAMNAREFAEKYLTREGILDYTQKLLISLKEKTGVYSYPKSFSEFQREKELEILKKIKGPKGTKKDGTPVSFFVIERKYYFFHAIEWLIRKNHPKEESTHLIYENKNSTIKKTDLCGIPIVIKTSKEKDLIHEAFVTLKCTNYLLEKIPNFLYCFGYRPEKDDKENLYLEYIEGETFLSFLNSPSFTIENYIFLLVQVCLALQVAQNFCGFVHNDLVPWNIILQKHENPIEIHYVIGEKVYTILSDMIPIIIDMNRSHVIYKDTHYGKVNMFSSSSVQDIITLLTTSLFEITKKDNYAKELIILANFMSGTRYRPKPFIFTGKGGLGDLRFFLNTAKKFENLVEGSKFELEEKRPIDLVNYILTNFHFSLPVKMGSIYEKKISCDNALKISFSEGSAIQVYNYALAKNREEQLASFIEFFDGIKVKTEKNPILAYYYIQKYYSVMKIVREQLNLFDSSVKISWFNKIKETLKPVLSKKPRKLGIPAIQKPDLSLKYDEKDFYNKKKILNLIIESEKNPLNEVEILENYKELFLHLFLYDDKYSLPQEMREFCKENFSEILAMDEYKIKVFNANVKTLKIYAELC